MKKDEIYGVVLYADGKKDIVRPANGTDFSLEEMQEIVGGYIEVVYMPNDWIMIVNEEGKLYNMPINEKATYMFQNAYPTDDVIVGNALICKSEMVK